MGPEAPAVIIALYGETTSPFRHLRLLQGLGWFDDPAAVDFIKQEARDSHQDAVRSGALTTLGISQGAREEAFISGYLADADPDARVAAARALQRIGDAYAQEKLDAFRAGREAGLGARENASDAGGAAPARAVALAVARRARHRRAFRGDRDVPAGSSTGRWTGFWVLPKADGAGGLPGEVAVAVGARTRFGAMTGGEGDLSWNQRPPAGQPRALAHRRFRRQRVAPARGRSGARARSARNPPVQRHP